MTTNSKAPIVSADSGADAGERKHWSTPQIIVSDVAKRTHKAQSSVGYEYHLTTSFYVS